MTDTLWIAILAQIAMGGFDTLYHHEGTERLAWRPDQALELRLHGVRNLAYAVMFAALGWTLPQGLWAIALLALMGAELLITLWDFVEEDRTRRLPASERVTHTLLTLNYGVILALLVPQLLAWARLPTAVVPIDHGWLGWFCALAAAGVAISGARDLLAGRRCPRLRQADPAGLADALTPGKSLLVTGGTGFIGSRLVESLARAGHRVTILTRSRAKGEAVIHRGNVRLVTSLDEIAATERFDAIVNLAGEPISNGIWTRAKRMRIVRSRLEVTYALIRLIRRLEQKPEVLVSGSAIGVYGLRGDQPLTEANLGTACFSRRVCVSWERAARKVEQYGVRTVLLRTGLVLDHSGGMLARMLAPFEFGVGGRFGDGRHWMSWIHRDDLIRLIVHCIAQAGLKGRVNATAPEPVTNRVFTKALGRALRRPTVFTIPAWPMRKLLGGFAEELLLGGQRVYPEVALSHGFCFRYPDIDAALGAITGAVCEGSRDRAVVGTERPAAMWPPSAYGDGPTGQEAASDRLKTRAPPSASAPARSFRRRS